MNREDAIGKIKKALALVGSANENEAETAARQARALMEKFRLDEVDLQMAEVEELQVKTGSVKNPVLWERKLARLCANAYGCESIFTRTGWETAYWKFVGVNPAAQLSAYAFEILFRAAKKARSEYMQTKLTRFKKKANKTAKADSFAEGFVSGLRDKLPPTATTEQQDLAINRFIEQTYPEIGRMKPAASRGGNDDCKHRSSGYGAGKEAQLHAGVAGKGNKQKLLGVA